MTHSFRFNLMLELEENAVRIFTLHQASLFGKCKEESNIVCVQSNNSHGGRRRHQTASHRSPREKWLPLPRRRRRPARCLMAPLLP